MSHKAGKLNRMYQQTGTLLMLAVYLFFAMGDLSIEIMHKVSHAWQNSTVTSHSHGSRVHSHSGSQHQHEVLAFLNRLVSSSEKENPLEAKVKIEVDKHLIQDKIFHLGYYFDPFIKHFSLFSRLLLSRHSWGNTDPPEHLS